MEKMVRMENVSLGHGEDTYLPIVIRDNSNNQQEKRAIQTIAFYIFKNLKTTELFSNMPRFLTLSPRPASISTVLFLRFFILTDISQLHFLPSQVFFKYSMSAYSKNI